MGCNGTVDLNRVLEKLPEGASVEDVKCSGNTIRVTAGGQEYTVSMQDAAQDKCRQCTNPNAVLSDVFVGPRVTEPMPPADGRSARCASLTNSRWKNAWASGKARWNAASAAMPAAAPAPCACAAITAFPTRAIPPG